jgi:septal ring factor EnvC (AmiA/AmiB activator)
MSSTQIDNLNDQIKQQRDDNEVIQLANEQLEATAKEQTENMRSYQDELEQREHENTRAEAKFAELVASIQEYQTTKAKARVLSSGTRKGTHNSRPRTRRHEKEIDGSKVMPGA